LGWSGPTPFISRGLPWAATGSTYGVGPSSHGDAMSNRGHAKAMIRLMPDHRAGGALMSSCLRRTARCSGLFDPLFNRARSPGAPCSSVPGRRSGSEAELRTVRKRRSDRKYGRLPRRHTPRASTASGTKFSRKLGLIDTRAISRCFVATERDCPATSLPAVQDVSLRYRHFIRGYSIPRRRNIRTVHVR